MVVLNKPGDTALSNRITLLAIIQVAIQGIVFMMGTLILGGLLPGELLLLALAFGATLVLYLARTTRFAVALVYANVLLYVVITALADFPRGYLAGDTWVLYQLWPPIAALTLRKPAAAPIVAVFTSGLLVSVTSLQLSGVLPVELLASRQILQMHLGLQVLVMLCLSAMTAVMVHWEQRSLNLSKEAQETLQSHLNEAKELLVEKEQLYRHLKRSVQELQSRSQELHTAHMQRNQLTQTVQNLAAPIVPVYQGVVVVPLVGVFDEARLELLQTTLLKAIDRKRVKVVVLDVTGLQSVDEHVGQVLVHLRHAIRLLGTRVILTGVHPALAQALVHLDSDITSLATYSTLQDGIASAVRQYAARSGKSKKRSI